MRSRHTTLSITSKQADKYEELVEDLDYSTKIDCFQDLLEVGEMLCDAARGSDEVDQLGQETLVSILTHLIEDGDWDVQDLVDPELLSQDGYAVVRGVAEQSSAPIQPLSEVKRREAEIYCSSCQSRLGDFTVKEELPVLRRGMFQSFSQWCPHCESERPAYTLLAVDDDVTLDQEKARGILMYWGDLLTQEDMEPGTWREYLNSIQSAAVDGQFPWLVPPRFWLNSPLGQGIDITKEDFVEFVSRFVSEKRMPPLGFSVSVSEAGSPDHCSAHSDWHVHFKIDGDWSEPLLQSDLTDHWKTVDVTQTEPEQPPTGKAVDLVFEGLRSL